MRRTRPLALVVEDSPEYVRLATRLLEREGFDVRSAEDGETGLELARALDPDVVLLDLVLPGMDGLEVCRRLRETSDVYIVMVTGRDDDTEKIVGLRLGADDYVVKPFNVGELAARIHAIRRRPRARDAATVAGDVALDRLLSVDGEAREVRVGGELAPLTRTEFDLVSVLTGAPRRVFTRTQLVEAVWGHGMSDPHVVDVHLGNLRRKLQRMDPDAGRAFVTVRGVGYRYEPVRAEVASA